MIAASGLFTAGGLLFITFIFLVLSAVLLQSKWSTPCSLITVALVGACRLIIEDPTISGASIAQFNQIVPASNIGVAGYVSGTPEFRPYATGQRGAWSFPMKCSAIHVSNQWHHVRGEVDVHMVSQSSECAVRHGDRILLEGTLSKRTFPGKNALELRRVQRCEVLPGAGRFSLISLGQSARETAARRLEEGIETMPIQLSVYKALVLGYRKEVPSGTMESFRRTGSLHIFAISGLHVGIVGLLLVIILKAMGIPRDWFGIWLLPLLFCYVMSTGMKSSALRALAMAAVFVLAPLFRRKPDIPSSVAFAAILLLLIKPMEILSAGFIYSFTVVAFIVMVFSVTPRSLLQGGWIRTYCISLLITSMAATLASVPLTSLYFGMFSPIALVGNLIVVPLTLFIVLSGWLSILIPFTTVIFNHAAIAFINAMLVSVEWLDRLPGSSWAVDPPPLLAVVLWFGSLIYLFTHASSRRQRWIAVSGAAGSLLLALLV
ncbi:MAG: hypothetical protein HKP10_06295 [Kiritimatiellales bacterium]|nr:hypothetical protein [Kiritimatiellales bacterium]